MFHHVPSPRRRTPVITALHASLPVTRKARAAVAADALDAPGAPAKQLPRRPRGLYLALALTVAVAFGVVFGAMLGAPASSAQDAPDLWVTASMLTPRNSHSLTELEDGRMLAAGGWDGAAPLASAEIFDPARRAWTPTGALSEKRAYHTAARLPDGRVLVAGGWDLLGHPLTSTEIYDPAAGVWQPAAALGQARAGHVAVNLSDGRILVAAGCGQGTEALATAEVYDAKAAAWQDAGELAEGRCWPTATVLADGRVLVVGGRGRDGQALASAELYDPTQNVWTPAGRLLTPRLEHTATLLPDGRVLVAGGYDGRAYLASAEVYDPVANTWTAAESLSVERANHAAILLRNGQVLVAGGSVGSRPSLATESYHPQTGQWTPAGPLPARYEAFLLTALRDGSLLVTGRPDSGDLTGNDGYPTPTPRPVMPRPTRTPRPWDRLLTPQPTPAPNQGSGDAGPDAATLGLARMSGLAAATTPTVTNYSAGAETAALYGVHEVSFTRDQPTATGYNPYAETLTVTFTPPDLGASGNITVIAFYDGLADNLETWRARVYVNRVGDWSWTSGLGANGSFTVIPALESDLRGMLRVSTSAGGDTPKRWYTDDGRTFLPMADTAYLLFFEAPPGGVPGSNCPPARSTPDAQATVVAYADAVASRGVNVLRVEALGTWAYEGISMPTPTAVPVECVTDLSLFWSTDKEGSNTDLFNITPTITQLATPTAGFFPNLMSFRNTDQKLRWLLESNPDLYIQMIIVPEPGETGADHTWNATPPIAPAFRKQVWRTMVARWAAFPNIFWSVSNDLSDTQPNNHALLNEIGCYFGGAATTCDGEAVLNPWRNNRPVSGGHLRNQRDAFAPATPPATPPAPWHNYITAYTGADLSAQHLDGRTPVPWDATDPGTTDPLLAFRYVDQPEPVLNTEDLYEAPSRPWTPPGTPTRVLEKQVKKPAYFFRRLFWSHLLSGSGATYGADTTWHALAPYSTATYTVEDNSCPAGNCQLEGLESIQRIPQILADAHIDLNLFTPRDEVIKRDAGSNHAWSELNRAQVAVRNSQEILAYLPNTLVPQGYAGFDYRRQIDVSTSSALRKVLMKTFTFPDGAYAVNWYNPQNGNRVAGVPSVINVSEDQNFAAPFPGDAILHISSRCVGANKCLSMDGAPPPNRPSAINGFVIGNSTIMTDSNVSVINQAWRCNGNEGCLIAYSFPQPGIGVSADIYFRRDTADTRIEMVFGGTAPWRDPECSGAVPPDPLCPMFATVGVVTGIDPDGAVFAQGCVYWDNISSENPIPWPPPCSTNLLEGNIQAAELNRWYRLGARFERTSSNAYTWKVSLDGVDLTPSFGWGTGFPWGDVTFGQGQVWSWSPTVGSAIWLDELAIDPMPADLSPGLLRTFFQQGLGGYTGTSATFFDYSGGYNNANQLHVGANNGTKSLLHFDLTGIPTNAVIDEAILQLYHTGRTNGNTLTLGAHGVLAEWVAAEANRTQRKAGVNWSAAGMASGSDYVAAAAATAAITGAGNAWIDLNITDLAQTWIVDSASNHGLVLLQAAASGSVIASFCSGLGWPPCTAAQAPKLALRYHLAAPPPVKAVFRQGAGGYSGMNATYFDGSGNGYNNATYLRVDATDSKKALLRFGLPTIPVTATVDEATLRLYEASSSNANGLTLAAHGVLADWTDSQASRIQRQTGVNWQVAGMGSGSDYATAAAGVTPLASAGGVFVDLDVKSLAQAWVADPATNYGLVLLAQNATGSVTYSFCSELGWAPCTAAQAPQLTIWYH